MASSLSPSLPAIFSIVSSKFHHHSHSMRISFFPTKLPSLIIAKSTYNLSGAAGTAVVYEKKLEEEVDATNTPLKQDEKRVKVEVVEDKPPSTNELAVDIAEAQVFKDPKWRRGTWDLVQFQKGGVTDWDEVINAEARRRKWLEDNPEASSTNEPVVFDTSIVPWWAWVKRYHLPEAELLNGRAAMVGFFMAYFIDSLSGAGLVDQMGNFFCKILLLITVSGVMLIRKNEDIEKLKKLLDETTFYDKQWQATWQDDSQIISKNK